MKVVGITFHAYTLPLTASLTLPVGTITEREGLLVRLEGDSGAAGWGEIAPLPGFSEESCDSVLPEFAQLRESLVGADIPLHIEELSGVFDSWLGRLALSPSVRCGMEVAALSLLANFRDTSLVRLLCDRPKEQIRINGLITDSGDIAVARATQMAADGYRTLKLKVGRGPLEDDIRLVHALRRQLPAEVDIRLDANRAWSFGDAVSFLTAVEPCRIEYVEEPLADSDRLDELVRHTAVPLGLDESLSSLTPETFRAGTGLGAIILKPTLLGGFELAMKFARVAIRDGLKAVVSSTFESGVGLAALAHLTAALDVEDTAHGLDTSRWLRYDLAGPWAVSGGRMPVPAPTGDDTIDQSRVREVKHE